MTAGPVCSSSVLIVDGANVVGSRPDGWWRDRAGAAKRLHQQLGRFAERHSDLHIVLVLEGHARAGVAVQAAGVVRVVHAVGEGDDAIVAQARAAHTREDDPTGWGVTVVTADRELRQRVQAVGASVRSPGWLLDQL